MGNTGSIADYWPTSRRSQARARGNHRPVRSTAQGLLDGAVSLTTSPRSPRGGCPAYLIGQHRCVPKLFPRNVDLVLRPRYSPTLPSGLDVMTSIRSQDPDSELRSN